MSEFLVLPQPQMVHHVGTVKDSFSSDGISELCCMTQDGEIQEVCMGLRALEQSSKVIKI